MITQYLGEAEVDAYLRDLGRRLLANGTPPTVWCVVGRSGATLAHRLFKITPELSGNVVLVLHEREAKTIQLDTDDPVRDIKGQRIMVIDSSVHTGQTMLEVVRKLLSYEPAAVTSYTLVLKRGSVFVPTYWGVTIGDHDRAYFLLDHLPNNRLEAKKVQDCHLRLISETDLELPSIECGVDSMDHASWADRLYDMRCSDQERRTYILEVGGARVGYLTYSIRPLLHGRMVLMVDEIAVEKDHQNLGHCGTMLRWAETMARQIGAEEIQLWAIEHAIPVYRKFGFKFVAGPEVLDLKTEKYTLMYKRVIYHLHLPGGVAPW